MSVRRFEDLVARITEGFGRFRPREFAHFLRIAAGSLHETKNHLLDGLDRGYLSAPEHERLRRLCLRAIKANARLVDYLLTCNRHGPSEPREP